MSEETVQPEPEKEPSIEDVCRAAINSPVYRLEGESQEDYKQRRKLKNYLYKVYLKGQNIDVA